MTDEEKIRERKTRIQHPHMIKSRSHWDWECGYYDMEVPITEHKSGDKKMSITMKDLSVTAFALIFLALVLYTASVNATEKYTTCIGCHGINAEGGIGPKLAGQPTDEIIAKLTAYRNNEQRGPMSNMMWGIAGGLSDQDIKELAEFIQTK